MKHAKRLVALALAAMLTVALLPATALAAGESGIGTDDAVYIKPPIETAIGNTTVTDAPARTVLAEHNVFPTSLHKGC